MDLAERLLPLADLVPTLEAPDADFGQWEGGSTDTDGVLQMPWFAFGPTGDAFIAAVGRGGWIIAGFDWMTWLQTDEGQALRDRPGVVETATPDQLARLLTAIVRSDRFVEGSIVGAFESGLLTRIAKRAATVLADGHA